MTRRSRRSAAPAAAKAPLSWQGALFAFAPHMLLATVVGGLGPTLTLPIEYEIIATLRGPSLGGRRTAPHVRQRGGGHTFSGGWGWGCGQNFFIF